VPYTGGCLCGKVRFTIEGEPQFVAHCHCQSCRRHSGAAVLTFAGFAAAAVRFTNAPARYASSPGVTRSFCSNCGTPLAYETEERPGVIDMTLGAFDEPERLPATIHVWTEMRIPWFHADEHLPRYARTPRDSKMESF
jgi:hypothetical protein